MKIWQYVRRALSSLWNDPRKGLFAVLGAIVAGWTLQCSLLQNVIGLDMLEALSWGTQGDLWGNVKHPPLSGWIALLFSRLAEGADWGLYLAGELCVAAGIFFTYKLARLFFDERRAVTSALLLGFLYYYVPSLLKFSTFFVEIAFTPLIAWSFFLAMRGKNLRSYALLGLLCGLGFLNKYSIGLLFLSLAVVMLVTPEYRRELKTCRPWLALLIFLAVISPHVNYVVKNGFAPLAHLAHRMGEARQWYDPLAVLFTALAPAGTAALVLAAAFWLRRRELEPCKPEWAVFRWSCLLSALPAAFLVVSSLCGGHVIMMWFSTLASFTGIMAVSLCPFRIDGKVFRNIFLMLWIYMALFFAGTTADLLFRSSPRIHMEPRAVTAPVMEWWRRETKAPLTLVVGDRWYGNIVALYSEPRPRLCEIDVELGDHWRKSFLDRIDEKGALVIGSREKEFADFAAAFRGKSGYAIDFSRRVTYTYKAPFGRVRRRSFFLTRIPPKAERER